MSYFFYFTGVPTQSTSLFPQNEMCQQQRGTLNYIDSSNWFICPTLMNNSYYQPVHEQGMLELNSPQATLNQIQTVTQPKPSTQKKGKIIEKQIESAKKNGQSNLINHFFSYFYSKENSQKIIRKCISGQKQTQNRIKKISQIFYSIIHFTNIRRGRKYINRKIIFELFTPNSLLTSTPQIKSRIEALQDIKIQQICKVFRKCCYYFFKKISLDAIMSSKRINTMAKIQHCKKRRKILTHMMRNLQ